MSNSDVVCPNCHTDDHVSGRPGEDGLIMLHCDRCEVAWERDPSPRCPQCGSKDVRVAHQAIVEKSRGTQLSIMGFRRRYLCPTCDAELWQRQRETNVPLPPDENPAG